MVEMVYSPALSLVAVKALASQHYCGAWVRVVVVDNIVILVHAVIVTVLATQGKYCHTADYLALLL